MLGRDVAFEGVPFFWTQQFDLTLRYVGHATSWDEIVYHGNPLSHDFLAFYIKDDRVGAVAGMNRDRELAAVELLMLSDRLPAREQLKFDDVSVLDLLHDPITLSEHLEYEPMMKTV